MVSDTTKRTTWHYYSGSQLTFGPGAVRSLGSSLETRRLHRVLVISDRVLESVGIVNQVVESLCSTGAVIHLYLDGEVEPSTETVVKVLQVARQFAPDCFVAVGGGSNMDLAKASAATYSSSTHPEVLLGFNQVPRPTLPLICLPTTAGTGSEVTHSAVIKNASTGNKAAILSQYIRPDVALVDPQLTLSCPRQVTAESGIDALTHAIEAYLVTDFDSFSDAADSGLPYEGCHPLGALYAEKAITLISTHLERAVAQPENLEARAGMSLAATLAGMAFSTCGVSLCHALEYAIGARYRCSHGVGNGIVLPQVMQFWWSAREEKLARIGQLMGVANAERMNLGASAQAAIERVALLRKVIGLPTQLTQIGAECTDLNELARTAASLPRLLALSPVDCQVEELKQILEASF